MLEYTMTPAQTDLWLTGGQAADRLAEAIAERLLPLAPTNFLVLDDAGNLCFTLEQNGGAA